MFTILQVKSSFADRIPVFFVELTVMSGCTCTWSIREGHKLVEYSCQNMIVFSDTSRCPPSHCSTVRGQSFAVAGARL